jgi:hypothetical protein
LLTTRALGRRLVLDQKSNLILSLEVAADVGDVQVGVPALVAIEIELDAILVGQFHT